MRNNPELSPRPDVGRLIRKAISKGIWASLHAVAERLPLSWMPPLGHGGPTIIGYHVVSDESLPHIENLFKFHNVREFEADLDYLLREFRPIGLDELKSIMCEGVTLSERAIYLTFDDGLREMAEIVAPILKRKGLPASFFICSDFLDNRQLCFNHKASLLIGQARERKITPATMRELEILFRGVNLLWTGDFAADVNRVNYSRRGILDLMAEILELNFSEFLHCTQPYMDTEQVRALARDGFAIGAHSVDHPRYAELNLGEQLHQTREGLRQLQERVGIDHKLFAFPFSDQGVGIDFYKCLLEEGTVEMFFGNSGGHHQTDLRLYQRYCLDGHWPLLPAKVYLRRTMMHLRVGRWLELMKYKINQ